MSATDSLYHRQHIGSLQLEGNLFFAPMAGYTDRITRALAYCCGAELCFTEMISAEGIIRNNHRTHEMLKPWSGESFQPLFPELPGSRQLSTFNETAMYIQLFGASPDRLGQAAKILQTVNPSLIDLNCGCPMPKVFKTGAGAALLASPEIIADAVHRIRTESGSPVTIKIRSGIDHNSINYLYVIEKAIKAGVSAVTLHPRTKTQGYTGIANRDHISTAVKAFGSEIPIFGSGDLFTAEDTRRMLVETGCSGLLLARGAIGNPFIFREACQYLGGTIHRKPWNLPENMTIMDLARLHFELAVAEYGEKQGASFMRKFLAAYTKGLPGGALLRNRLFNTGSAKATREILASIPPPKLDPFKAS